MADERVHRTIHEDVAEVIRAKNELTMLREEALIRREEVLIQSIAQIIITELEEKGKLLRTIVNGNFRLFEKVLDMRMERQYRNEYLMGADSLLRPFSRGLRIELANALTDRQMDQVKREVGQFIATNQEAVNSLSSNPRETIGALLGKMAPVTSGRLVIDINKAEDGVKLD
jgi:hypothetical protein